MKDNIKEDYLISAEDHCRRAYFNWIGIIHTCLSRSVYIPRTDLQSLCGKYDSTSLCDETKSCLLKREHRRKGGGMFSLLSPWAVFCGKCCILGFTFHDTIF